MFLTFLVFLAFASAARAEEYQEGFLTSRLNRTLEKTSTEWVSAPKFGGYIVGRYNYDDKEGNHGGQGFGIRLLRMYMSGTVLKDFKYRVQLELNGDVSLRDATIEWTHWKEFCIKGGQFKRTFTYGNTMNPMDDVGFGSYTQLVDRLTGFGDYCGEPSMNGRDIGLQFYGELFPVGNDSHRLIRYEAAVYNGNGQNRADNNRGKDWMGSLQVQPVSGLRVGVFAWKGTYTQDGITVGRNRWALSAKLYRNDWTAIAEYAHNTGHRIKDYDADAGKWNGSGRCDAWYATLGVPVTEWLKPYVRYDVYREQGIWCSAKSIYSICPNIRLHKNLLFQLQYNFVHDKPNASDHYYNEFKALAYIRF